MRLIVNDFNESCLHCGTRLTYHSHYTADNLRDLFQVSELLEYMMLEVAVSSYTRQC